MLNKLSASFIRKTNCETSASSSVWQDLKAEQQKNAEVLVQKSASKPGQDIDNTSKYYI